MSPKSGIMTTPPEPKCPHQPDIRCLFPNERHYRSDTASIKAVKNPWATTQRIFAPPLRQSGSLEQ
jgi:hypothetical protein